MGVKIDIKLDEEWTQHKQMQNKKKKIDTKVDEKVDAIVGANLNKKQDANLDEKVEENMGAIVGIKLSMNCGEINVDKTTDVKKKDTNLNEKRRKSWMQKGM